MELRKDCLPIEVVIGSVNHFADVAMADEQHVAAAVLTFHFTDYLFASLDELRECFRTFGRKEVANRIRLNDVRGAERCYVFRQLARHYPKVSLN